MMLRRTRRRSEMVMRQGLDCDCCAKLEISVAAICIGQAS